MGTLTSLSANQWRSPSVSVAGGHSRPTTPHGFRDSQRPSVTSEYRPYVYSQPDQYRPAVVPYTDQPRPTLGGGYQDEPV